MTPQYDSQKEWRKKNRKLQAMLPSEPYEWLEKEVNKEAGDSFNKRFISFIDKLKAQTEQGIPIFRSLPSKDLLLVPKLQTLPRGIQSICVRRTTKPLINEWLGLPQYEKERACELCKSRDKELYAACQEIKKEYRESQRL